MCGDFDGNVISVRPGDICIGDNLRPMKSQAANGTTISVAVPRSLIDGEIKGKLHGVVLQSEAPTTRLLTNFIQSLYALEDPLEFGTTAQIENALAALVAAGVSTSSSWNESDVSQLSMVLRERILNFIDMNLENTELNVALLMQKFQVSRAHIYRAFSEDGGVAKIIRERRLDAAYAALITPKYSNRSLEEIAYRFGVVNYSQFSRAFRARFGATPSCVRSDSRLVEVMGRSSNQIHKHFKLLNDEVHQKIVL
jgi:AraC-like DNA-binding protein